MEVGIVPEAGDRRAVETNRSRSPTQRRSEHSHAEDHCEPV